MFAQSKPKLLFIDDNYILFSNLKMVFKLKRGGAIEVVNALNGKEGLEQAAKIKPNLVFLDWMMPEFDGEYFLNQQSKEAELIDIPVVIYTGLEDEKTLEKIQTEYPAVKKLVKKPVIPTKLFDLLMPYLRKTFWTRHQE